MGQTENLIVTASVCIQTFFSLMCFSVILTRMRSARSISHAKAIRLPLSLLPLTLLPLPYTIHHYFFHLSVCACMCTCVCVSPCICYILSMKKKKSLCHQSEDIVAKWCHFGPHDFKGLLEGKDLVSRSRFRIGCRAGG